MYFIATANAPNSHNQRPQPAVSRITININAMPCNVPK